MSEYPPPSFKPIRAVARQKVTVRCEDQREARQKVSVKVSQKVTMTAIARTRVNTRANKQVRGRECVKRAVPHWER